MGNVITDLLGKNETEKTFSTSPISNSRIQKPTKAIDDEDIKDKVSNRNQRERFTKGILFMMACELIFIAILLFGIFTVPFINSLAPRIQINLPPLFFTFSLCTAMIFTYNFLNNIPELKFKGNNYQIKKIFKYSCIILLIILMNAMPRQPYTLHFQQINLSDSIINIILYASVSVFVKTTVLAGLIITGLYDVLKKKT